MPSLRPSAQPAILWTESFDALDPERWRNVEVHGRTTYETAMLDARRCLQADSRHAASILLSPLQFDPDTYEWLSWQWRVEQPVAGEDLARKDGSDAAARVYVYFETAGLPWQKRSIDYVWSASVPVGTILESAFSSSSQIIVVDGGPEAVGRWRAVARNVEEDYRRCFGSDPPDVVAIGLMTDTDNTHGQALAYYDELQVSRTAPAAVASEGGR